MKRNLVSTNKKTDNYNIICFFMASEVIHFGMGAHGLRFDPLVRFVLVECTAMDVLNACACVCVLIGYGRHYQRCSVR